MKQKLTAFAHELEMVHWATPKELKTGCVTVAALIALIGAYTWVLDGVMASTIRAMLHLFG